MITSDFSARINTALIRTNDLVDKSDKRWYINDKMTKLGTGLNFYGVQENKVWTQTESPANPGFTITPELSELRTGQHMIVQTPLEEIEWGPEGYAINPLLKHLPIGTIAMPFKAFQPVIPFEVKLAKSAVDLIKSVL